MRALRATIAVLAAATTIGLAAGCGGDDDGSAAGTTTTSQTVTTAETGPGVSFLMPADGSTVSGGTVEATVDVQQFMINAENVGKAPMDGEGHLHFSMDGGKYDTPQYSGANGELAVTLGVDGMYSPSVAPTITYTGLPAGEHTLKVWLADNSHNDTGVSAETTFTVE